ncbi:phosphatase PAP2 family protein [Streptomyces bauhiniae]|uniref:Phosphatase PAP2 family protein n=1 Tax=Streptomyces bauhiniae TaxID=2340725 RepID=A0A4Z1D1Z4_9ACTN|nr:phosphatase PAP2 family protein [Streptomyces bauhiniae]TGN75766.1 phosphatase PAP2 family protein [Streptomyces bauhiniae]
MSRQSPRTTLLLALPSALLLTLVAIDWSPLLALDEDTARTTHRWAVRDRDLTQTFRVLTDWVWDPVTMRLLCAGVALWLVWRRAAWWTALWLLVTCAVAAVVQQAIKAGVARPRPVWPDPVDSARFAAFPSGHAMTATVVCGLLLWLIREHGVRGPRWYGAVAVATVSVLGVGLTRVWLGVHWFSDVLGGWLFGALVVAGAVLVHERRSKVRP